MTPNGFLVAEEKSATLLTLIVDKKGIFGPHVAKKIHQDSTTVLVTEKAEESWGNTLCIPYTKTIPEIPEGNYSHIFFVWDGRAETLHVLEPLLQKAAVDKAQFLFITDYHCYTEKLIRFIYQEYARASVVLTGDIFGNEQYQSIVTMFFQEAHQNKTLQLENVGLRHVYPVFFPDVVAEILKVGFGSGKGKIYLACQQHGMTELSLAHVLQKVDPLIKIDFKKEERSSVFLPTGEYLFDVNYEVIKKIQDAYTDVTIGKKEEGNKGKMSFFSPNTMQQEVGEKTSRKKQLWLLLVACVVFFLLPLMLTLFYAALGGIAIYAAGNAFKAGEYQNAARFAQAGKEAFSASVLVNEFLQKESHALLLGNGLHTITNIVHEGKFAGNTLEDGAVAAAQFSAVLKGSSLAPQADFLSGINAVKNILMLLEDPLAPGFIDGISLHTASQQLQPLGGILDIAPTLFGFSDKKTYMILLQNNAELRPGGGFIGSFALIALEKGRIVDFTIHDVYDADGQLKGHVEPPYVVRRYIPEQHWYLRDSNFDVDFSQDAANAAFFLQQETGQKIDGVIGVDLTFVKDIIAGIGPVYVPTYNQTVTADNFFLLTETHAEKKSFAGSTQKKDFLHALFVAMQAKVGGSHNFSPKALLPLIGALRAKDMVFGFSDPLVQKVFTVNGLSSSLWDGRKTSPDVLNDFAGINEANIGVNKANYYVTRSVAQTMSIDPAGSVSGKLSITYKNNSKKGMWPGGIYKNYQRVILPSGAKLSDVQINHKSLSIVPAVTDASVYEAKGFVAPQGLEVDSATAAGKQLYGFIVTVPEQEISEVTISYVLSQKIDIKRPTFTYESLLFKQPGVNAYPYTFVLSVPGNMTVVQKSGGVDGDGSSITYSTLLSQDENFSATFSHK